MDPLLWSGIGLILFLIVMTVVIVWNMLKDPRCGGTIDPTKRWCDAGGRLISNRSKPVECDQTDREDYTQQLIKFMKYITRKSAVAKKEKLAQALRPLGKTYQGIMLFAVPSLLKILPSDFGQNYISPYGVVSFFEVFLPCIEKREEFCSFLSGPTKDRTIRVLCHQVLPALQGIRQDMITNEDVSGFVGGEDI